MPNIQETTYDLDPAASLALLNAGRQARKKLAELEVAAEGLDHRYSQARCRHELAVAKAEHRRSFPRGHPLRADAEETKGRTSPRSRFSRAVADCRAYDLGKLASTGAEWAKRVLFLNWLMTDVDAHLLEPTCEFQELAWDAASEADGAIWQGRQVTAENFLDGKWLELVSLALARLDWDPIGLTAEAGSTLKETELGTASAAELAELTIKRRLPEEYWDQVLGQYRALLACSEEYVSRSELKRIGLPPTTVQKYWEKVTTKLPTRGGQGQGERSWQRAGVLQYVIHAYTPRKLQTLPTDIDS